MFSDLYHVLAENERLHHRSFNMTPSENILSPLARLPFSLDIYSRYFLDDLRLFGRWFFPAGEGPADIEREVLFPLMQDMARASYVNVRPISGINCMTVVLAALTQPGDTVLTVPLQAGGHASTSVVAKRFGLNVKMLPFVDAYDIDLEQLAVILEKEKPALLYLDQSTLLFPIDSAPLRALVDSVSPNTLIHYDSSHLNGLMLAGKVFNPLEHGAHIFGGSTHKTLPGPHKGFLATNDCELAKRIQSSADHFVSHHHMADVASLAVTMIEMKECGGDTYAQRVLENAKLFATTLVEEGIECVAGHRGYTDCHQVWAIPELTTEMDTVVQRLQRCGIIANNFNELPGVSKPAFRLSAAEFTRLGATEEHTVALAKVFAKILLDAEPEVKLIQSVAELRFTLNRPHYCFEWEDLLALNPAPEIEQLCYSLFHLQSTGVVLRHKYV